MPRRRTFLASSLALGLLPVLAAAAAADERIGRVERYLNGIETLRAGFTQIAPDGALATGRLYLHRPGRMRFEYDPPEHLLMVATDWRVVMQDTRTLQTNTVPVSRTPLAPLLEETVRLSDAVTVRDVGKVNDELYLTLYKTDEPGLGELELVFGQRPIELRRWRVLDAQGKITQILLEDLETNVRLERDLFTLLQ
ncbi:MAG: LolA family protein [Pseudomonadota bacterium]